MLPRADLNATRPPASVEPSTRAVSSTDARLETLRRLNQIAIGKELQGVVDSLLDDGSYLVKIADGAARMALPTGTQIGDKLAMVFIAREPRPTFLLTQQGGSAPATLSTTARLIDQALQTARQNGETGAVAGTNPLLASAGLADAENIAAALRDALARSGLFYESHLQDWLNGKRSPNELAQEPQAHFGATPQPEQADLGRFAAGMRELGEGVHKLLDLMRDARLQAANPHLTDADVIARANATPAIDAEAARMISLQLNTLEQQQLRWRGELWPGQQLEWEIDRDQPDGSGQEQEAVWNSAVRFELPHLGNVSASIRLAGDHVQVQINTGSDEAAAALRGHAGMLADALAAAGSQLDALLVKRDEPA
jgi:hypothetical protein